MSPLGRARQQQVLLRAPLASASRRGRNARPLLRALLGGHLGDQVHDVLRAKLAGVASAEDLCAPGVSYGWMSVLWQVCKRVLSAG